MTGLLYVQEAIICVFVRQSLVFCCAHRPEPIIQFWLRTRGHIAS